LHQAGVGVILDWVPSHFPGDEHGIYKFDGTNLYEHADPRKGFHPDWKSYIFNYGRNEVRSFLISNAIYWLQHYHIDGLRVDAVASMLYLDYSRKEGEWIPNEYGGRENIEAINFLKEFNEVVYSNFPDAITIAEESTAWPGVSRPTYLGGLGFGQKWMMGWMHDTLHYFQKEPVHRRYHQNEITFSIMYAFTENFMLPLSHDEVVHGKGSLMGRMPGDEWRRFANLRLLYGYMFTHPGTKLLFMGAEFGQTSEWNHDKSLDWHLLQFAPHIGIAETLKALHELYKNEPALYHYSFNDRGFQWIDYSDRDNSVIVFKRLSDIREEMLIVVCNFTPDSRQLYRIGVPFRGQWKEVFNSDEQKFGGSGVLNQGMLQTTPVKYQGLDFSITITLPPLGVTILKLHKEDGEFELGS
jgi:1,4-alpha-glucan branching enzyme